MLCEIGNIGSSCPTNHFSNVHELILFTARLAIQQLFFFPLRVVVPCRTSSRHPHTYSFFISNCIGPASAAPRVVISKACKHTVLVCAACSLALLIQHQDFWLATRNWSQIPSGLTWQDTFRVNRPSLAIGQVPVWLRIVDHLHQIPRRIEVRPWDRHTWLRTTHHARTHWQRSARTGSTRVARSAGMKDADSATIVKRTATPAYVAKSVALTP